MRTKPANWDTYLAEANSYYAVRIDAYKDGGKLGQSYTYEDIISAELSQTLYGDVYGIGNTVMNQLTLTIDLARKYGVAPKDLDIEDYFPKLAAIRMSVWVANERNSHSTLPVLYPTFTTDKPDYDKESGFATIVAYDGMYLLNVIPFEEGSVVTTWHEPTLQQVATHGQESRIPHTATWKNATLFQGVLRIIDQSARYFRVRFFYSSPLFFLLVIFLLNLVDKGVALVKVCIFCKEFLSALYLVAHQRRNHTLCFGCVFYGHLN